MSLHGLRRILRSVLGGLRLLFGLIRVAKNFVDDSGDGLDGRTGSILRRSTRILALHLLRGASSSIADKNTLGLTRLLLIHRLE